MNEEWVQALLEIAVQAGAITCRYHPVLGSQPGVGDRATLGVQTKADDSPVTQADLAANEIILRGLATLTPHIPVVSEETPNSLQHLTPTGRFWLVDPLDGTRGFVEGDDSWTVNIALIEDGRAVWGVVYAPLDDRLYWGGPDTGSFVRSAGHTRPLQVSRRTRKKTHTTDLGEAPLRVLASRAHMGPRTQTFIRKLGKTEMVRCGSSVKLCLIATGEGDLYPRLGATSQWDTAAAQAVLEGAGGEVLDLEGRPLRYGQSETDNPYFVASCLSYADWKDARP